MPSCSCVIAEEIEYEKQESRCRFMLDMNTMKIVADREGFERGAADKQREIAKNMKAKQIYLQTIFELTGLPLAEIESL